MPGCVAPKTDCAALAATKAAAARHRRLKAAPARAASGRGGNDEHRGVRAKKGRCEIIWAGSGWLIRCWMGEPQRCAPGSRYPRNAPFRRRTRQKSRGALEKPVILKSLSDRRTPPPPARTSSPEARPNTSPDPKKCAAPKPGRDRCESLLRAKLNSRATGSFSRLGSLRMTARNESANYL